MQTLFLSIFFLFMSSAAVFPQSGDSSKIAAAVDCYVRQNGFSGTILVARKGEPVFHQSYGLAYRSTPDTIQNNYHFPIASVTKLFTSIRILQLAEQGLLDLGLPVTEYLPEYIFLIPEQVTVHHLLLHISGLPEESDNVYHRRYQAKGLIEKVLGDGKMNTFGEFNYNNMDYVILGLIIESLTGNSWQEEIEQSILKPLNMHETGFLAYGIYPQEFAYTYSAQGKKIRQDPLFYIENYYAAGSMYATASDLLKLDQALYSDLLLRDRKLLKRSYKAYNYAGYGVWNYNYPFVEGQPAVMERRGGILGANVVLVRLTDDNYTIIILSNDDRFNPDSFGDKNNLREILIQVLYQ